MDIMFVLAGISIYFTAAAIFALEYAKKDPLKAGLSFAIPPYGWVLYSQNRNLGQQAIYSQLVAIFLVSAGVLLIMFFEVDKKIFWQPKGQSLSTERYVGSDKSLNDLAQTEMFSDFLNGRVHGRSFVFNEVLDSAEFDTTGTLRIKQGSDFHGPIEIAIELNAIPPADKQQEWRKIVRESDTEVPVIYLFWLDKNSSTLQSRRFDSGYSMDLGFTHNIDNHFFGKLRLVLPDAEQSYLNGDFSVYSSRLRFTDAGLDRNHDSNETLELLAAETLINTYKRQVKQVYGFAQTDYDYRSGEGLASTIVYLGMTSGSIKRLPLQFYKNEAGWFLDVKGLQEQLKDNENLLARVPERLRPVPDAGRKISIIIGSNSELQTGTAETEITAQTSVDEAATRVSGQPVTEKVVEKVVKKSGPLELTVDLFTQSEQIPDLLQPLINKEIEIVSKTGKVTKGYYIRIDRQQVVVETLVGSGVIEYLTEFVNLQQIRVLNDETVRPQTIKFYSSET